MGGRAAPGLLATTSAATSALQANTRGIVSEGNELMPNMPFNRTRNGKAPVSSP